MYRPIYHFAPPRGWLNDPNGLVCQKGWWHLFYQHEPTQLKHGPMHWGHAASRDLVTWQHFPVALWPDALGDIWSGSAAVCERNGREQLVACFTHAHAAYGQVQSLAFSDDEGRTWQTYTGNPVLTSDRPDFRDPKIFRYADGWRMVVAAGSDAQFYASPDLLVWTLLSSFPAPDATWIWECPDLFEIDGSWVLLVSFIVPNAPVGASCTRYYVGDFDGTRFTPHSGPHALSFGPDDYAAVSWSDAPDGRRVIIGWMSHWAYAGKIPTEAENWRGAMTLPRELSLRDGTLRQHPPRELLAARGESVTFDERGISFRGEAYALEAEIDISALEEEEVGFALRVGENEATRVVYHVPSGELRLDRRQAGQSGFETDFAQCFSAPLDVRDGRFHLHFFVDRCSVEVFAEGGALYGAALVFPSEGSEGITFVGRGARLTRAQVYSMDARP